MVFNEDVLFVHVPKTGGSSVTVHLLDVLARPVYLSQPHHDPDLTDPGIVQLPGIRHETLAEARDLLAGLGFSLDRFRVILATIRNPYDLDVSRYAYLRTGNAWERGAEQELAMANSFEEFAVRNRHRGGHWTTDGPDDATGIEFARNGRNGHRYRNDLRAFFTVDGRVPANLRVLRFEHLVEDVQAALRGIGVGAHPPFPWLNRSPHDHYLGYYTPRAEAAVYRRYRWAFDEGLYPRLDPSRLRSGAED